MRSIRRRVLLRALGVLAVALTLLSAKGFLDARHETEELFDAQLARSARLIAGMLAGPMLEVDRAALQSALDAAISPGEGGWPGHRYETKLAFQLVDDSGAVRVQSASAPAGLLDAVLKAAGSPAGGLDALAGYHDVEAGRHLWRVFVLRSGHAEEERWVLTAEREDVRGELISSIALGSLIPDLVGLPLVALLVWLAIGSGLRPLREMVAMIRARDPERLTPLSLAPLPSELEPVVAALNRLLAQVDHVLEREKRFLADAAHELRTPLAVLRIQAQNALDAGAPEDREAALRQLHVGVERATRVVEQLLTLARLEPGAAAMPHAVHDVAARVRAELAELTPLALARDQELEYLADDAADLHAPCDADGLAILLRNLVGNAVRHAPRGGHVRVSLGRDGESLRLTVEDDGPGVAITDRTRLTERFCRLDEGGGAGLGLSIVRRIVELHAGALHFGDSPLGGLEVTVELPAARGALR
ncbi:MAG: sensor histidine kinase N-terminal domain-containing protein [Zoogloeaceae bacterium]|nr:sensor histidine kinase N-terminal domain-containing protein [Zoogloeaceae bacterium]